jgi:hypothetical protein
MHDEAAVHKDEWEEFFQHFHRLQRGNFWKSEGRVVDWDRYIDTLVQPILTDVVYAYMHHKCHVYNQNCSAYTYTLQYQLHYD